MKKWIKQTFSEYGDFPSWLRQIGTLIIVVILFNWTYFCIRSGQFISLDWTSLSVLIGVLAAKALQKTQEGK